MAPTPPVTVAQQVYLARYITSDADGGFATVGLGAHDRWLQEGDRGSSIPDVGIGVVVSASGWYPELATGNVVLELIEPSGRAVPLNEVDGATAFSGGTPGEPYRVAFAIQHHDVPTPATGPHRLRVTTTLGGPAGQPPTTIVSEVELPVHAPGAPADAQRPAPPPTRDSLDYL